MSMKIEKGKCSQAMKLIQVINSPGKLDAFITLKFINQEPAKFIGCIADNQKLFVNLGHTKPIQNCFNIVFPFHPCYKQEISIFFYAKFFKQFFIFIVKYLSSISDVLAVQVIFMFIIGLNFWRIRNKIPAVFNSQSFRI